MVKCGREGHRRVMPENGQVRQATSPGPRLPRRHAARLHSAMPDRGSPVGPRTPEHRCASRLSPSPPSRQSPRPPDAVAICRRLRLPAWTRGPRSPLRAPEAPTSTHEPARASPAPGRPRARRRKRARPPRRAGRRGACRGGGWRSAPGSRTSPRRASCSARSRACASTRARPGTTSGGASRAGWRSCRGASPSRRCCRRRRDASSATTSAFSRRAPAPRRRG